MRIIPHTAVDLEANRPTTTRHPATVASISTASKTSAVTQNAASSNPFSSVLQSVATSAAAASTARSVAATSIFGPTPHVSIGPTKAAEAGGNTSAPVPTTTTSTTSNAPSATGSTALTGASGTTATSATTSTATASTSVALQTPGVQALVSAIMNGSFQPTYVTDPSKLQETTPVGTDYMPSFYYASDATANQMASLLGGTVVQRPAFGQDKGWNEPLANFIQLPNGQTFNAADVAYYAKCGSVGASQLTADLTQTINEGSAWSNYYTSGGPMPSFAPGYVGPPISGMTYPASMIGSDGNVINPAMQGIHT